MTTRKKKKTTPVLRRPDGSVNGTRIGRRSVSAAKRK
jgi:hypothetical protein